MGEIVPWLILFGLFLLSSAAQAEVPRRPTSAAPAEIAKWPEVSRKIHELVKEYDNPHTPGGIIAVVHGGETVHLKGYGAANRELRVPWTPGTRYRIASITKSFVAHALLLLEERGELSLDDSLQQYLPDFPTFDQKVTLLDLMTMSSGLWQDEHLIALAGLRGRLTLDEMYALSRRQERLNFTPGSTSSYVDTNYRLLARVLTAVTGKPFPEVLKELIFEPLGMRATLADPNMSRVFDGQAMTYVNGGAADSAIVVLVPFAVSGDGSILTTMHDMTLWLKHLRDGSGAKIFRRMIAPVKAPGKYRRGIYQIIWPSPGGGRIGWGHAGATGTSYVIWPDHDLLVAHFSNSSEIPAARISQLVTNAVLEAKPKIAAQAGLRDVGPDYQWLTARDVELFSGTFVEPQSGYTIVSEPWDKSLVHYFLGSHVLPTRITDGHYRQWREFSAARIEVEAVPCDGCDNPDLLVHYADWPAPRSFLRAAERKPSNLRVTEYVGQYYSRALGVHYTVESDGEELTLRIGAGIQNAQIFQLQPLLSDCFLASTAPSERINLLDFGFLSVRFDRGAEGKVHGMRVSIDKVRDLHFELVHRASAQQTN